MNLADKLLKWFDQHGRKDLPWQQNPTPYRVWVSEIMLQQTQVTTVTPYYLAFMQTFPDVLTLANADQDSVLQHWAGLGYYSRAHNLHYAARQVRDDHAGNIPDTLDGLMSLKGIGRSTAGAILSLAYQQAQAVLDGNVKRVLSRYHAIEGWPGHSAVQKKLWELATHHLPVNLPKQRNADYTQAIMDLGATVCSRSKPDCQSCPLLADCKALRQGNPDAYPSPKPRKKIPSRSALMLLLVNHNNQVLIEKRPPTGIWGGLWSLPQFDNYEDCALWYQKQFAVSMPDADKLPPFVHTFSHFRLQVQPLKIDLANTHYSPNAKGIMEAGDFLWYNSKTNFSGGFPAPIKKLFKRIHL